MSNLNFGNKEFLNIQSQVLKNAQDIEVLKGRPLLEIKFVEELPETGLAGVLYLVPMDPDPDTEDSNSYDEYVWTENGWELVGSTPVDISNMVTTDTDQTITGVKTVGEIDFNTGAEGENTWKISKGTNQLTISQGSTDEFVFQSQKLIPMNSNTLGTTARPWAEAICTKYTVATSGYDITKDGSNMKIQADGNPIQFRGNIEPTVDGTYALGKSNVRFTTVNASSIANDYSALSIKGKGGISITCDNGSAVRPSQNEQLYLGSDTSRWNRIYVGANGIDFGNNAWIQKDGSNRLAFTFAGNTVLKIGAVQGQSYIKSSLSPDQDSDDVDLGRTGQRWNNIYVKGNISDGVNSVTVANIATKPDYANPDVFESGTLDASGQGTIDMTQTGIPSNGLYMFTYGNCQCFLTLTSTMIQNAATYPIRCPCPMMYNGSAYPGILKIERAADVLTLTVATAGVGNVTPSGFGWQLIKVM